MARERIAELTTDFVSQVAVSDSIAELISVIGHASRRLAGATAGSFVERVGNELKLHDLHRINDQVAAGFQQMAIGDSNPIADCVRRGKPLFYGSQGELIAAYPHLSEIVKQGGHGAYAVLPLPGREVPVREVPAREVHAREVHGAVAVMWDGPRVLQAWERRALVRFAEVCGRTFPRVKDLQEERGFAALEAELSDALTLTDVIDIVVPAGQKLLDATSGQMALVDGDRVIQMAALAAPTLHSHQWMDLALDGDMPVCHAIRDNRTVFLIEDAHWQEYPAAIPAREEMGVSALLITPFTGPSTMSGALAFSFALAADANPRQQWLAERLAVMTGRAIARTQTSAVDRQNTVQLHRSGAKTLAEQRRLQNVLDGLFVSVGLVTPDGILLEANQTAYEATGTTAETAVGQRLWELPFWPSPSRRLLHQAVRRAAAGETVRFDILARLHGQVVPLDFQICPIFDELGAVESLVMSAIDISERKRTEARQHELLNRHRAISRRLQRNLLPQSLPTLPNAEVEARYRAAGDDLDVGGDWYDAFWMGNGCLALTIGDIVGRGIDAAGATGQIRAATRALADVSDGPADVVTRLDHFASTIPAATAATMIFAEVDLETGDVVLCRAGHIPPLTIDASGNTRIHDEDGSTPLGVVEGSRRPQSRFTLSRNAHLLLCTDGLVERRGESLTKGLSRLATQAAVLAGDLSLAQGLEAIIDAQGVDAQAKDDLCALVLRRG